MERARDVLSAVRAQDLGWLDDHADRGARGKLAGVDLGVVLRVAGSGIRDGKLSGGENESCVGSAWVACE